MIYLWILQIYRKRKRKGKGFYPYPAHWAQFSSGPAQWLGWTGGGGDVGGGFTKCANARGKRIRPKPSPLKRAGPSRWVADARGPSVGFIPNLPLEQSRGRGGVDGGLPVPQATVSGELTTGVLRGPGRVQPWVARSPRGTGLSRASAAADQADGDDGTRRHDHGEEREKRGREHGGAGDALVQPRGEGEWWWMRILAEADGMAPAMGVVGGREEGGGLV